MLAKHYGDSHLKKSKKLISKKTVMVTELQHVWKAFAIMRIPTYLSWLRFFRDQVVMLLKNIMTSLYGWGSTASRLEPLRGSNLLFPTKFLEIPGTILSTSERWKAESTLESSNGFEQGTPGLEIQRLNHEAIAHISLCYTQMYLHLYPTFHRKILISSPCNFLSTSSLIFISASCVRQIENAYMHWC